MAMRKLEDEWQQRVTEWFPELDQRTFFVPNVQLNRLNYRKCSVAGQEVLVTQPPVRNRPQGDTAFSYGEAADDAEIQRLVHCLRALADSQKQVLFVLTQLGFHNYLSELCAEVAAAAELPRPEDMKKEGMHRGDFDLLVIHRDYGVLVGELKAVGYTFEGANSLTQEEKDSVLAKRVTQAVKQLHKQGRMLSHLTSDLKSPPRVRKTLLIPNVSRSQLCTLFDKRPGLREDLIQCLQPKDGCAPEDLCLCADDVSETATPYDVTDDVMIKLLRWWGHVLTDVGKDDSFKEYRRVVARFAGPASTVRVFCVTAPRLHLDIHLHTEGHSVSETGKRFTHQIVLHPAQVDVLRMDAPRVFLFGPPGTGKTLLLVLKAFRWLQENRRVIILSAHAASLAASHMIEYQLRKMAGIEAESFQQQLQLLATDKTTVVRDLLAEVDCEGRLFVIADEAGWYSESHLCDELNSQVKHLHLWAAHCRRYAIPKCLTAVTLREPLRSPPVVVRQIQRTNVFKKYSDAYSDQATLPTCDGPPVRYVYHQGEGHSLIGSPGDCVKCGEGVARELHDLGVGQKAPNTSTTYSPEPLRYRDVLLVTHLKDPFADLVQPAGGIVQGLRAGGVPVKVVRNDDLRAVADMALMAGDADEVVCAEFGVVGGLERNVVVVVDSCIYDDRFYSASRCSSQLIWVTIP